MTSRTTGIRIGVEIMAPLPGISWADTARAVEGWGYSTMFLPDHVAEGLGPVAAMATAAQATTELTVSTAVFCADLRNPVVLAKELATIDILSQGRLEVGLGAGYQVHDYRATGIRMDPPATRVSRLVEYVELLKGFFSAEPFAFHGEHFDVEEVTATPAPYTPGGPPLFIAGGGRRMLTFAARQADIVGVNPSLPSSDDRRPHETAVEAMEQKLGWAAAGSAERERPPELHAWVRAVQVTDSPASAECAIAAAHGVAEEVVRTSPFFLIGTVDQLVDRLLEQRRRWGFSYYTIPQTALREFAPVLQLLASADAP